MTHTTGKCPNSFLMRRIHRMCEVNSSSFNASQRGGSVTQGHPGQCYTACMALLPGSISDEHCRDTRINSTNAADACLQVLVGAPPPVGGRNTFCRCSRRAQAGAHAHPGYYPSRPARTMLNPAASNVLPGPGIEPLCHVATAPAALLQHLLPPQVLHPPPANPPAAAAAAGPSP